MPVVLTSLQDDMCDMQNETRMRSKRVKDACKIPSILKSPGCNIMDTFTGCPDN
jgi:hypothetical protein